MLHQLTNVYQTLHTDTSTSSAVMKIKTISLHFYFWQCWRDDRTDISYLGDLFHRSCKVLHGKIFKMSELMRHPHCICPIPTPGIRINSTFPQYTHRHLISMKSSCLSSCHSHVDSFSLVHKQNTNCPWHQHLILRTIGRQKVNQCEYRKAAT